jgi:hypothetical protein
LSDEIRLVLPAEEDFHPIAHLVVGGLAARLELTFEQLEDLQLAVESVLGCRDDGEALSVIVGVEPEVLRTSVGPFSRTALADLDGTEGDGLGLRRVLATVTDGVEVAERDGGAWVEFTKARSPSA